jgi:predicted dehydrogenase
VHWLDGFRWMLGCEATRVACAATSSPAIDCEGETDAHVQIAFSNGTLVSYTESFSSPVGRCETLVIGELATLRLGYDAAELYDTERRKEPAERRENPFAGRAKPESAFRALDEFLTALERGTEPSNSGRDNLKTIALLEAAYRSAAEGRAVELHDGTLA